MKLVDAIRANIESYTAMNEQERLSWVRNFFDEATSHQAV